MAKKTVPVELAADPADRQPPTNKVAKKLVSLSPAVYERLHREAAAAYRPLTKHLEWLLADYDRLLTTKKEG